jgi:hypothetical protein
MLWGRCGYGSVMNVRGESSAVIAAFVFGRWGTVWVQSSVAMGRARVGLDDAVMLKARMGSGGKETSSPKAGSLVAER